MRAGQHNPLICRLLVPPLCLGALVLAGSCGLTESRVALLWTDRPEIALYASYFNSSQDEYTVEVRYLESPSGELSAQLSSQLSALTSSAQRPDIVAASWLKSASIMSLFSPMDGMMQQGNIAAEAFYPRLLAQGRLEEKQYLLPVSFNLPALIFARDQGELLSSAFIISLEEIQELGGAYNRETRGAWSQMGFSPVWDQEFLYIIAALFDSAFREASPLAWDAPAIEEAVSYTRDWISAINKSVEAGDDFVFKYFYEPVEKLTISGRILFSYKQSADFFTLTEEERGSLGFRWIAGPGTIPISEGITYLGICKYGQAPGAAAAFVQWFFQEDTQRQFLESGKQYRINENTFGIAGGFSALKTVTERIFPQYYPGLLGHMPPEEYLSPPAILPGNWTVLKERIVLPYLYERIHDGAETASLDRRLAEWIRLNRD
ncbi:MAG: extracellular solute-binding protein [Treponema sp.]|jgi:ABC-type glycerol-3-phosphate transport system substrate-binding protein|nr:extracellular solute-binding protein [Treponema sp.]